MHFLRRRHLPATVWAAQLQPLFGRLLLFIHGLIIYQWSVQCRPLQPHGLHGLLAVCSWPLHPCRVGILCRLQRGFIQWQWRGRVLALRFRHLPRVERRRRLH